MFSMPVIAFSSGAATVCSSTSADAPGYTAGTVTTGGAISGYCAIGSVRIAARPGEHDEERDDRREDRTVDEEAGEHRGP